MEFKGRKEIIERVVVGMTGDDRLDYGLGLLETLHASPLEVHLVLSARASDVLGRSGLNEARKLVAQVHPHENQAARISSGSFLTRGMIVAPCSAHSAAAIGIGLARNLVQRAADVTLKERRPLVLGVPEPVLALLDLDLQTRLSRVPGLHVVALDGPAEDAARGLLAQLGIEPELLRA